MLASAFGCFKSTVESSDPSDLEASDHFVCSLSEHVHPQRSNLVLDSPEREGRLLAAAPEAGWVRAKQ